MEIVGCQKLQKKLMRVRWEINVTYQSAGSSQFDIKLVILIIIEDHKGKMVKSQMLHP